MTHPIVRTSLLLLVAILIPACDGGGPNKAPVEVKATDPGIESFPSEGQEHVPVGTQIVYQTDPPTSGPHYPDPWPGGFYSKPVDAPSLVHSMEHGAVILYYNDQVNEAQKDHLRALAVAHPGVFAQVIAVPRVDATYPIILTAWTHRLRLTEVDASRIDGFVALFLNQGPERQEDGH